LEVNEEDGSSLSNHEEISNEPTMGRQVAEVIENKKRKKSQNEVIIANPQKGGLESGVTKAVIMGNNDRGAECLVIAELSKDGEEVACGQMQMASHEKSVKGTKLGARNTGSFKGRIANKNNSRATVENKVESSEKNKLANIFKEKFQPSREFGNLNGIPNEKGGLSHQEVGLPLGFTKNGGPYAPRPPDLLITLLIVTNPLFTQNKEDGNVEKENFLDASDQVGDVSSDSDMEVVKETPTSEL
jgi:hypothetical protein